MYFSDLATQFDSLPDSIWEEPAKSAMVVPLNQSGQQQVVGFLILAVSPRRAFDDEYRGFFEVVASQVETAIANAHAYEVEHKRAETLAELDRAKTAFFNNVSHEFRTPLTLMLSPLEETISRLEGTIPLQESEQLQLVQRNARRLLKLVNSLLDFSRVEAGRVQAHYEPIDLSTYTSELASAFRSLIEQAGMSLIVRCPPLPEPIYVDRDMWEKIILNLLSNAFKFTWTGTITVELRWHSSHVELLVTDTGVGITPEELPQLFVRFHRVKNTQGRSFEGSGIGLSLVQELVKLHNGTIEVMSTIDQGSCFRVLIPTGSAFLPKYRNEASHALTSTAFDLMPYIDEAQGWLLRNNPGLSSFDMNLEDNSVALLTSQPINRIALTNLKTVRFRILLVDDNTDMRDYIQRLLSNSYIVQTAVDGVEALEVIQNELPDLVLTDIMMPRMDGLELLRSLRTNGSTEDLPIILLSARAGEESRIEGLTAGADDYLIKPFSARELVARVEATLKLAQLRRNAREREQALLNETKTAKTNLDQIVSSLRDGFMTLNQDWRYTYVNNRQLEILKLSHEDLLGKNAWELFPELIETEPYHQLNRAMNDQVEVQFEFYYPKMDCWIEHRVYPTPDGIAILVADVSDRKQAQIDLEARANELNVLNRLLVESSSLVHERNQELDRFVYVVSHDLKAPLRAISNLSQWIEEDLGELLTSRTQEQMSLLRSRVQRMESMINGLLNYARSGQTDAMNEQVSVEALLAEVIDSLAPPPTFEIVIGPGMPTLRTKRLLLSQVFSNLISNGIGHHERPNGSIRISVQDQGEFYQFIVADDGPGIASENHNKIFMIFQTANPQRKADSSGIGLSIVRKIVEAEGGTIRLDSELGKGTTFFFTWPK